MYTVLLPDPFALLLSIVLMAGTIAAAARTVLQVRPTPIGRALVIAAVSNLLGKLLVSVLLWPAAISYTVPTLAFLLLSQLFFRPRPLRLVGYWLFGFALYLGIHVVIATAFGWTFMFPFWVPRWALT